MKAKLTLISILSILALLLGGAATAQGKPLVSTIANPFVIRGGEITSTDTDWVQMAPISSPPGTYGPALAYDSTRRRVVLFTGYSTWEYDGMTWVEKPTPPSMPHRGGHAMVYDSARDRIVLFGGVLTGVALNDTWEYDGTTWVEKSPVTRPPARSGHAMAYDSARGRVILFGGESQNGWVLADTWEYDGTNWIERSPATRPDARVDHAMAYDSDRGRVILFGGADYSRNLSFHDTWEYDGTTWQLKQVDNSPPALANHAMAYDSNRHRVVLFGGSNPIIISPINQTWEYDGATWVQIATTNSPPARYNHAMAYDNVRGRIVLFGGYQSFIRPPFNDTWEYYALPHTNDDFDHASLLPEPPPNGWANQHLDPDTNDATVAPDDPDMGCGTGVNSHTIWFKLTPSYYGRVRLRTYSTLDPGASSNYDTVVAVFTGQRGALNRIACNDDAPGHEPLSDLTFEAEAGKTYYIEVAAYDNTPGGVLSLFVNYEVEPKAWTLMFYFAANNDLESALKAERDSLVRAAKNLNVNIVALWDDNLNLLGSKYLVFTPYGLEEISKPELNTGDPSTISDFVSWAINNYPANHYALVINNHGQGFSGTSVDSYSGGDWLNMREMSLALLGIYPKPDIIYMDACLMGTVESAYQLAHQATYYVASQSIVFGPKRLDCFVIGSQACGLGSEILPIRGDTSPEELAMSMAENYYLRYRNAAGTISVVRVSNITDVAVKASNLAGLLKSRMSSVRPILEGIWSDVQRFDEYIGDAQQITTADRPADLYHFAYLVQNRVSDSDIKTAAGQLMGAINNALQFEEHWSGSCGHQYYWDHENAHGISVFLPPSTNRECYYNGDWLDFAYGTDWQCQGLQSGSLSASATPLEWGPMLVEYINQTNPSAPENRNPPVPVPMLTTYNLYLPLILRSFGGAPSPTPTPTPTPPPSGPTIRVEPTSGPLGTRFNIYGSGFVPGESVQQWVIIPGGDRFDDPTPETVDSQGNYTSWVQIDSGPTGTYTLYARGNQSQQTVSAQFVITASGVGGTEGLKIPRIVWGR